MVLHTEFNRTCESCRTWVYDDVPSSHRYGLPMVRAGQLIEQDDPPVTPCGKCPKISDAVKMRAAEEGRRVTHTDAVEPGPMHRAVVEHFLESEACREFDAKNEWVRRHARIIRPVYESAHPSGVAELGAMLKAILQLRSVPNG